MAASLLSGVYHTRLRPSKGVVYALLYSFFLGAAFVALVCEYFDSINRMIDALNCSAPWIEAFAQRAKFLKSWSSVATRLQSLHSLHPTHSSSSSCHIDTLVPGPARHVAMNACVNEAGTAYSKNLSSIVLLVMNRTECDCY